MEQEQYERLEAERLVQEHRDYLRLRNLFEATPHAYVCRAIIVINVLVFLAQVVAGVSPFGPTINEAIQWGASNAGLVADGDYWRLLTAAFVHFGVIHLGVNMWALHVGGPLVERLFGSIGFTALYLFSALIASLVSLLFHPQSVGAGASGAIFGVFGGLYWIVYRRRELLPELASKQLQSNALRFLGINLLLGFAVPAIDVAAHAGGAVAGLVAGACLARSLPPTSADSRRRAIGGAVMAVLLAATAGLTLSYIRDRPEVGRVSAQVAVEEAIARGDFQRVADIFTELLEQEPDNPEFLHTRGQARAELHQYDAAIADHSAAIAIDPSPVNYWLSRGLAHLATGQLVRAEDDFRRSAERCPDATCKAGMLENIGLCYLGAERWAEAVRHSEAVDEIDDGLAWNALFRGIAADRLGDASTASAALDRWRALRTDEDAEVLRPYLATTLHGYLN